MTKRESILNAAVTLFGAKHPDSVSTLTIAREAGVSNGTLFHYFPTKTDLISQAYLREKEEMFQHIYAGDIESDNLHDTIRKGWMRAVDWSVQNRNKHIFIHKIHESEYAELIEEEQLPENYKTYLKTIRDGIANKELKQIPASLMVNIINLHVDALAEFLTKNPNSNTKSLKNKVFQLTWEAIRY